MPMKMKITLPLLVAALAGCATHQERVATIQGELPQLVAGCNGAFRDGSAVGLGIVVVAKGIEDCDRLAFADSLDQVRPATAEVYKRYKARGGGAPIFETNAAASTSSSAGVGVQSWAPQMPLPSLPVY